MEAQQWTCLPWRHIKGSVSPKYSITQPSIHSRMCAILIMGEQLLLTLLDGIHHCCPSVVGGDVSHNTVIHHVVGGDVSHNTVIHHVVGGDVSHNTVIHHVVGGDVSHNTVIHHVVGVINV